MHGELGRLACHESPSKVGGQTIPSPGLVDLDMKFGVPRFSWGDRNRPQGSATLRLIGRVQLGRLPQDAVAVILQVGVENSHVSQPVLKQGLVPHPQR
ncbi:MAG: hypothetical protein ACI87O_001720 [Planctomycetota bacterium]